MPVETRRIEFSRDELVPAIIDYCRDSRLPVPRARHESLKIGSDPERLVILTFAVSSPVEPDEIALTHEQLTAALLAFCRRNRIALPPEEAKGVIAENGGITLLFECRRRARNKSGAAA